MRRKIVLDKRVGLYNYDEGMPDQDALFMTSISFNRVADQLCIPNDYEVTGDTTPIDDVKVDTK